MRVYLLVGRMGDMYAMTNNPKIAALFKAAKPGRKIYYMDALELADNDIPKIEGGVSEVKMKSHLFVPGEGKCMYCPCKVGDPDAQMPCLEAPSSAPDYVGEDEKEQ